VPDKVTSPSGFIDSVSALRDSWRIKEHEELWFRGERKKHPTFLRPALYRPRTNLRGEDLPLKSIPELIDIESRLYQDFQRCAVQLLDAQPNEEDWNWDSYFLMQHHGAPTRLLDWSDGGLMALHFAVRNKPKDDPGDGDAFVYVLEPYRLLDKLDALPDREVTKAKWKAYVAKNPSDDRSEDDWDESYLPSDEGVRKTDLPTTPLALDFPHITRRVAAQRSRFMVFGTEANWLAEESTKPDSSIAVITIDVSAIYKIRIGLRDSGVTESVIFPDLDGLGREMKQLWEDRK